MKLQPSLRQQDNVQANSESVQCRVTRVFQTRKVFDYQNRHFWVIMHFDVTVYLVDKAALSPTVTSYEHAGQLMDGQISYKKS